MTDSEKVRCWFCAEEIQAEAKKCKHCGEWVKPQNNSKNLLQEKSISTKNKKNEIIKPFKLLTEDEKKIAVNFSYVSEKEAKEIFENNNTFFLVPRSFIYYIKDRVEVSKESNKTFEQLINQVSMTPNFKGKGVGFLVPKNVRSKSKKSLDALLISSFSILVIAFLVYTVITNSDSSSSNNSNNTTPSINSSGEYIQKENYFGAYNKSDLELLLEFSVHNDRKAIDKLIGSGRVFFIKAGIKVYLVESSGLLSGMIKVRPEGETQGYWVLREALK